jgi:hypothetical protein
LDISEPIKNNIPVNIQPIMQTNTQYQETSLLETQQPVVNPGIFNFFDNSKGEQPVYQNIVIPVV